MNALYLLLIVIGFGLVIVVHELGHFLAARWAGIRVHAFAVGFGQAVCSYRKGMGFRAGSTEPEYVKRLQKAGLPPDRGDLEGISPTEYRLNWIPFGGYVKMLGQEDMDPAARSSAPDAYNNKSVPKRLVVISAGVVMNVLLAFVLFMVVFGIGMQTPPAIVGGVDESGPADRAGVMAGDVIVGAGGAQIDQFAELAMIAAMNKSGTPLDLTIRRPGENATRTLTIEPARDTQTKLMQLGVYAEVSNTIAEPITEGGRTIVRDRLDELGMNGVEFGAELVSVAGVDVEPVAVTDYASIRTAHALRTAIHDSRGAPITATFRNPDGRTVDVRLDPAPAYQTTTVRMSETSLSNVDHLLGLTPALRVGGLAENGEKAGLKRGDIFARIGTVAWPDPSAGIAEIRARAGSRVELTLLRDGQLVEISAPVGHDGRVGFSPEQAFDTNILANIPTPSKGEPLPAARLSPEVIPGMRVIHVAGVDVNDYEGIRRALRDATRGALSNESGARVTLGVRIGGDDDAGEESLSWELTSEEVLSLHELGWNAERHLAVFQGASYIRRGNNPIEAVAMGIESTRDMLVRTYITFLRLFDGTVKVEHLRGPVGIADVGVQFASRGPVYVMYFLALISANLAVINFLPIPFVDGGHALFLVIEGIMRKPVPIVVQNVATLAGIALIGTVFLIVTFNDITRLFG